MIKLVAKQIVDTETGITGHITHKSVSVNSSNQGSNDKGFVFRGSSIETVEKIANCLLRFAEAAKSETISDYHQTNE